MIFNAISVCVTLDMATVQEAGQYMIKFSLVTVPVRRAPVAWSLEARILNE
jgi:hypothetical protein